MHDAGPILCLDAAYSADASAIACAVLPDWESEVADVTSRFVPGAPAPYVPGEFYRRELPLLLSVLNQLQGPVRLILIDGYVWLDGASRPGLGVRLFRELGSSTPVVGVAKTRLRDDDWSLPVCRGGSRRPLYVTAVGMAGVDAAEGVRRMHGRYRIPTALAIADRRARDRLMHGA